jgi:hypothetical protein
VGSPLGLLNVPMASASLILQRMWGEQTQAGLVGLTVVTLQDLGTHVFPLDTCTQQQ